MTDDAYFLRLNDAMQEEGCWKQLCRELLLENNTSDSIQEENSCFGRPGSQIDQKIEFRNKFGEKVFGIPVIIDFNRILQLKQIHENDGIISGVSNRDLLHAVCGLYDISLPDMESEIIYNTVCAKWARTIAVVQDIKDATDSMTERLIKKRVKNQKTALKNQNESKQKEETNKHPEDAWKEKVDEVEDVYREEEEGVNLSAFIDVFSDTDDDEDENDDEDEEEDDGAEENYTKGIHTFIKSSFERRRLRENSDCLMPQSAIGIENRLLGCVTFEKKFIQEKQRIVHITLISIRPRYRHYKIGQYLLSKCVSPVITGNFEAVVVHADNSAVNFFGKYGFSSDVALNKKWSELADAFTNCTLMTYFPPFSGHSLLTTKVTKEQDADMFEIDQELEMWQRKSQEAYQGQLTCILKFRNEILQLKNTIRVQNELLNKLVASQRLSKDTMEMERDLMSTHLDQTINSFTRALQTSSSDIKQPVQNVSSISNTEIITRFIGGMEADCSVQIVYNVTSITKACLNSDMFDKFENSVRHLHDPSMVATLYFCGSLEKPSRLQHILTHGFSEEDFCYGEFGRGLYFSKYPSKASQFSVLGKLLEVQVALGNTETVLKCDRTRKVPSEGYDSIFTPGRLYRQGDNENAILCQEYIVFNVHQVIQRKHSEQTKVAICYQL
ncbi:hypothetical protein Btru_040667 [Bulinus truncatus]|nr:hypothetical protein Btru_040667 [Bulinus truncatus]